VSVSRASVCVECESVVSVYRVCVSNVYVCIECLCVSGVCMPRVRACLKSVCVYRVFVYVCLEYLLGSARDPLVVCVSNVYVCIECLCMCA